MNINNKSNDNNNNNNDDDDDDDNNNNKNDWGYCFGFPVISYGHVVHLGQEVFV